MPVMAFLLFLLRKRSRSPHKLNKAIKGVLCIHLFLCLVGEAGLFYLFLHNTKEMALAKQWHEYTLVQGQTLSLPRALIQSDHERPLIIEGIFDKEFQGTFACRITTVTGETDTETLSYDTTKQPGISMNVMHSGTNSTSTEFSGYRDEIFRRSTHNIQTIDLLLVSVDRAESPAIRIRVGREYLGNPVAINKILVLTMIFLAIAGILSLSFFFVSLFTHRHSELSKGIQESQS